MSVFQSARGASTAVLTCVSPGDGAGLGTEEGPVIGCGGLFISPSFLVLHEGGGVNLQEETSNLITLKNDPRLMCTRPPKTTNGATKMRLIERFGAATWDPETRARRAALPQITAATPTRFRPMSTNTPGTFLDGSKCWRSQTLPG